MVDSVGTSGFASFGVYVVIVAVVATLVADHDATARSCDADGIYIHQPIVY